MHLKRLRVFGFKSFAQDTSIEFEPGITVLVGPNGGGKSNVVDAIRWGLGEQRLRDLRAERWEDLLHHGAPAARLAEVVLEFDNSDGEMPGWPESLSVARRYYRSGDSEYLINGQSVRLKDVTDLFLDSGLGKFNYAIISQGRVEGALLQKPQERLEQLEEASGVSRYKVRKRETLAHLNDAEDKLVRLRDLSDEVARQMEEVRERAETESRYRTWEVLRRDWQNRLAYTEFRRAMDKRERLSQQLARLQQEREELARELGNAVDQAAQQRAEAAALSQSLEDEAAILSQLTGEQTRLRLMERELESQLGSASAEEARLHEALRMVAEQRDPLDKERGPEPSCDQDGPDPQLTQQREAVRQRLAELTGRRDRLAAEQRLLQSQVDQLLKDRRILEQQQARLAGLLRAVGEEDLAGLLRMRQAEALTLEAEVRQAADELSHLTEQRGHVKEFFGKLEQELYGLRHQLAGRQARLRALLQLDAEGAGLQAGVRAVLAGQQSGKLSGVLGTLQSLVHTDPELGLAIDTALGGSFQDLVTQTEAAARAAVSYLKAGGLGRATFLPLDTVRVGQVSRSEREILTRESGVVGWASALVQCEPLVQPAVSHVLGRVLIVKTLEDATRLGPLHNFRYKMVTLDGQVVHAGGAITGGSRTAGRQSPRNRAVEVDELTRRIREDSEVVQAKEELLQSSRQELDDLERDLDRHREILAEKRHRWQEVRQSLQFGDEGISPEAVAERLQHLDRRLETLRQDLAARADEMRQLEEESQTARVEQERLEESLRDYEQTARERQLIRERIRQEIERLDQQAQRHLGRLAALAEQQGHWSDALAKTLAQLQAVDQSLAIKQQERADRVRELAQMRERVVELENRQRVLELEDRRLEQRVNTWTQEEREIAVRFESYQPPDNLEPLSRTEEENARREVQRITESLQAIGTVVPGSLALFEQLQERHAFLVHESQDVEEARQELLATLKEIDEEMDRRVKATAAQVQDAFQESCRQLYGGGEGGFTWMEGEPPGLELWVRPAGKRPTPLGLLSGGEKALGGIAWLFSLLAVRPSPFVVLDEVEASLDEANAMRFAQFLKTARGTAQYVVVTHQRQTMEAADALWGVAGDGQGRSRLVSVRLADVDAPLSS